MDINDRLKSISNKNDAEKDATVNDTSKKEGLQKVQTIENDISKTKVKKSNLDFIMNMKVNSLQRDKELEAQRIILDTEIEKLNHQADATKRQSKAYWDARSVDFAEGIKTYAQNSMDNLENKRNNNKIDALKKLYENTIEKVTEVNDGNLPEILKEKLITEMWQQLSSTEERIKSNTMANKYDLGPN